MKREVAELWVEALRSGKYSQTKAYLQDKESYCCLGVLCKIYPNKTMLKIDSYELEGRNLGDQCNVQIWASFQSTGGDLLLNNYMSDQKGRLAGSLHLTVLNDTGYPNAENELIMDPLNFDEIADVIQMCWEEL